MYWRVPHNFWSLLCYWNDHDPRIRAYLSLFIFIVLATSKHLNFPWILLVTLLKYPCPRIFCSLRCTIIDLDIDHHCNWHIADFFCCEEYQNLVKLIWIFIFISASHIFAFVFLFISILIYRAKSLSWDHQAPRNWN